MDFKRMDEFTPNSKFISIDSFRFFWNISYLNLAIRFHLFLFSSWKYLLKGFEFDFSAGSNCARSRIHRLKSSSLSTIRAPI